MIGILEPIFEGETPYICQIKKIDNVTYLGICTLVKKT